MIKKHKATLVLIVCIIVAIIIGGYQLIPPTSKSIDTLSTEFSAERAKEKLEKIASKPRPIGSTQHEIVYNYILTELQAMGVTVETQETISSRLTDWGVYQAGPVRNIIARLKGTGEGQVILAAAHYDSTPTGPGASDDGIAVSSMLETIRALQAAPPLKNDIIFLFSDAEEVGLLGAQAFLKEHRWAKDVDLVFNFEARGSSGVTLMFETGEGNRWLINELAQAAPHQVTFSFLYDLYKLLSNDTDMTVFKSENINGLNFAFVDGYYAYHTPLDTVDNVNMSTYQHHGSTMLALLKHFGNIEIYPSKDPEGDATYFTILNGLLISYSQDWTTLLTILVLLMFLYVCWFGMQKGMLEIKKILLGFFLHGLNFVVIYACITGLWGIISSFYEFSDYTVYYPDFSYLYLVGLLFLSITLFAAMILQQKMSVGYLNLAVGMNVWWLILVLISNLYLPGAHYLFFWPLFGGLLSALVALLSNELNRNTWCYVGALSILAMPSVLLFTPLFYFINLFVTLKMAGLFFVTVFLLLGLLIPQWALIDQQNKWRFLAFSGVIGLSICLVHLSSTLWNDNKPKVVHNIMYCQYTDDKKALWASTDKKLTSWTKHFFQDEVSEGTLNDLNPTYSAPVIKSKTSFLKVGSPEVSVLADQTIDGLRYVELLLKSPREADELSLFLMSDVAVKGAKINGKELIETVHQSTVNDDFFWGLEYTGAPKEGVRVELILSATSKVQFKAIDLSYDLPQSINVNILEQQEVVPVTYTITSRNYEF